MGKAEGNDDSKGPEGCRGMIIDSIDEVQRLRLALHEIVEEWAGAECGVPVYAQEAYAIGLAKRMYQIAADALNAKDA